MADEKAGTKDVSQDPKNRREGPGEERPSPRA